MNENSASLESSPTELPWWNRPVMGKGGLLEDILSKTDKKEIPESIIALRHKQMLDLKVFAKTAEAIDSEKLGSEEFLTFVKIKYLLTKGIGEYAELGESARLLQFAINAKDLFISIDQTELRYRNIKQQEFYSFVEDLLKNKIDANEFQSKVAAKGEEILSCVKTEEGQKAMTTHVKNLQQISENDLGLELLSLFKTFQLADYSILTTISDLILNVDVRHFDDIKTIINLVNENLHIFQKLRNIIKLSELHATPQSYAVIIQYVSLSHNHGISYLRFDELMKVLRKWYRYYQKILQIVDEYPESEYKWTKNFTEPILGESIFLKYKKLLTDPKTGMVYYDFE